MSALVQIPAARLISRLERLVAALDDADRCVDAAHAAFDVMAAEAETVLDAVVGSEGLAGVNDALVAVNAAEERCARIAGLVQRHVAILSQRIALAEAVPEPVS